MVNSDSENSPTTVFEFRSKLWKHQGPTGWFFLTVPKTTSSQIRKVYATSEEGWGRLKATAKIGASTWQTSIWFDTKFGAYLLPVRFEIRKNEEIDIGQLVRCRLEFKLYDCMMAH